MPPLAVAALAGRKRHILVDTNGLVMAALVGAASTQDRDGVAPLLARDTGSKTRHLWLDSAYEGRGVRAVRERGWTAEVVRRSGYLLRPVVPAPPPFSVVLTD